MRSKAKVRWLSLPLIGAALLALAGEARAIIGLPFTPFSFAGVARRTARRSAYYGAVAAGAAVPGAVPMLPPGCAVGIPCGSMVYRPYYYGPSVVYAP
jgi:hypothetical protein